MQRLIEQVFLQNISISDLTHRTEQITAYLESDNMLYICADEIPEDDINDILDENIKNKLKWYNTIYKQAADGCFEHIYVPDNDDDDAAFFPCVSISASKKSNVYVLAASNYDNYFEIMLDKNALHKFLNIFHYLLTTKKCRKLPEFIGPLIKG